MKFSLIITLLFSTLTYGQFRKLEIKPPSVGGYPKSVLKIEKQNHKCVNLPKKTFSTILKKYPFNKTAQIKLVSFKGFKLPIENDTVCFSKLYEIKTLTLRQIDSLTNIMYNIGFGGTILIIQEMACYQPRNAIIFVDNFGKAFEYIEICFECEQTVNSSERIEFGEACDEKFNLLKRQFQNSGISYGIKEKD
jgi:adenylate cyclase class IV